MEREGFNMNNIETIENLRERSKKKKTDESFNEFKDTVGSVVETTRINGIKMAEGIKAYAQMFYSMGEDRELIEYTKETNKNEKVKNIFVERIKRR
jgi:hypothetical protein